MKKEILERFLRGLGSLFKKRGQYFNPESPDFGELGTLIKGTSKTKPVPTKQLDEADEFAKKNFPEAKDPEVDYETAAALKKSRKRYDLERKNLNPLTKHLEDLMEESNKKLESTTNELKIQLSEMEELTKQMDEFNRIADDEGVDEALEQLNRILNPKRTLNADGGRIGKFKGGILGLLKRVNPALEKDMVKTGPFQTGHRGDVVGDMEQIKSLIRNELTDLEEIGKLEDMVLESPRYGDQMKSAFMKLIDYEKFRANAIFENDKLARYIKDDPEGAEAFLQSMYAAAGSQSGFNEGGRVGMFKGGKLLGEGIAQAARLVKGGKKPFGQKQTYKQKVNNAAVGGDSFQKAMKQHFDKELYLINKVKGPRGNPEAELFDLYEEIASKERYSMLPEATRSKMLSEIDESLKAMDVDGADYQNFRAYLFDEYKFPNETAYKDTVKSIDTVEDKINDLINKLADDKSGELSKNRNVIPFKPRNKKAKGGHISEEEYNAMMKEAAETDSEQKAASAAIAFHENMKIPEQPIGVNPPPQGFYGRMNEDMSSYNIGKEIADDLYLNLGMFDPEQGDPSYSLRIAKQFANGGITSAADIDYINEEVLDAIRNKPMKSRSSRMSDINSALKDLEKYLPKLFEANQGGLTPPQKGPMSEGMGTLYRRK